MWDPWRKAPIQATGVNNVEIHIDSADHSVIKAKPGSYELCLLLTNKRFGYAIIEQEQSTLTHFKTFQIRTSQPEEESPFEDYQNIFANEPILQQNFGKIKVAIHNRWMTLIPEDYFREDQLPSYLSFNLSVEPKFIKGYHNGIGSLDCHIAYGIAEQVENFLKHQLYQPAFYHSSVPFLQRMVNDQHSQKGAQVYANVESRHLQVAIMHEGKFRFLNQYRFKTTKDFIYYLLLACDEHQLDRDQLDLTFSGDITEDSAIYKITRKYIRSVTLAERLAVLNYPAEMQSVPAHSHQNLLSLALCG